MSTASAIEIILLLMVGAMMLVLLAQRLRIAFPIALVLGGLAIAFVPGLPRINLEPDVVFSLFLPPLLFASAFFMPWEEFRLNLRPILLLAFGLVLVTATAVAFLCQALFDWPLAVGFVLGAIISPPDAVAASAVAQRLPLPRRVITVLEGESLVNDAAGLVLLKFAVAAVVTGQFSMMSASGEFLKLAVGGVAWGLAMAYASRQFMDRLDDPETIAVSTLFVPFACYLPAEHLGLSGVLAAVAGGMYFGYHSHDSFSPSTRLKANAIWAAWLFLLNGLVFILIGLQLPTILQEIVGYSAWSLFVSAAAVSGVVIVTRILWVFPAAYLPRALSAKLRKRDPYPSWRNITVISWCGMRGIVSLAAALALPLTTASGDPFPHRALILFLAFSVILVTLVVQGLSLTPLIKFLGLSEEATEEEVLEARRLSLEAALIEIDKLATRGELSEAGVNLLRQRYRHMLRVLDDKDKEAGDLQGHTRLIGVALSAERKILRELMRNGVISDVIFRRLDRDLDLQFARLDEGIRDHG
jgi:Na+/H+ antiporter